MYSFAELAKMDIFFSIFDDKELNPVYVTSSIARMGKMKDDRWMRIMRIFWITQILYYRTPSKVFGFYLFHTLLR